ncbi:MAG: hypothetical protein JXM73_25040, partial [Anaerolineae bacterium]|nr:hypothetical protein [Anaerolineae bacterium]
ALEKARAELEEAGVSAAVLAPYGCRGLQWTAGELVCEACRAGLHELPTHLVAIPTVARQQIVREQQARIDHADSTGQKVVYLSLAAVLGGKQIADDTERDEALVKLKQAIDEALDKGDVVALV